MTISDTCRIWLCMTSACMHVKFVMSLLCNYLSLSPICYIYPSSVIVSFLSSTDHTLLASQSYFCLLQIEFPLFLIFISPSSLLCWKLSLLFHSISLFIVFCFWFNHFHNTYSACRFVSISFKVLIPCVESFLFYFILHPFPLFSAFDSIISSTHILFCRSFCSCHSHVTTALS